MWLKIGSKTRLAPSSSSRGGPINVSWVFAVAPIPPGDISVTQPEVREIGRDGKWRKER